MSKEKIEERQKIRAEIADPKQNITTLSVDTLLLISESIDDYIEHRIQTEKALEGILKDIQGNTAIMAEKQLQNLITGNIN